MPIEYARVRYVVSFTCDARGIGNVTKFVRDIVPTVYANHRHLVQGFFLSRHYNLQKDPPYNDLWLNYRIDRDQSDLYKQVITDGSRKLMITHEYVGAEWMKPEDEEEAFGEVPEWRGLEFQPTLWIECEFATLQAHIQLTGEMPSFLHPWGFRHILRNVLGQE